LKTSGKKKKILLTRIPPGLLKSIIHFIIPYFYKIYEKFKSITRKFDFNIAYKLMNCTNNFIKTGKEKIKKEHSNDVYKINHEYNYFYVGQTKRKLKMRLKEQMI